ncbi:MAG: hypothetical protein ACPL3B_04365 [Fervidobacterium sp.]
MNFFKAVIGAIAGWVEKQIIAPFYEPARIMQDIQDIFSRANIPFTPEGVQKLITEAEEGKKAKEELEKVQQGFIPPSAYTVDPEYGIKAFTYRVRFDEYDPELKVWISRNISVSSDDKLTIDQITGIASSTVIDTYGKNPDYVRDFTVDRAWRK